MSSKLDGYVKRLEDEMRKIEVFKRELPLCMIILKDGGLILLFFFSSVKVWICFCFFLGGFLIVCWWFGFVGLQLLRD